MISFFITLYRLARAVGRGLRDPEFRALLILVLLLLDSGTIFYGSVERWGWIDALNFSVATLATVGHGGSPRLAAHVLGRQTARPNDTVEERWPAARNVHGR